MDLLAKATIQQDFIGPQKYHIDGKPWMCYIKGQWQIKNVSTALHHHINTITIEAHWTKNNDTNQALSIWSILSWQGEQQQWVVQSAAKFLPYGTNMRRWKLRQEDKCPQCHQEAENKHHITQCQAQTAQTTWEQAIEQLDQWLLSSKMDPGNCQEIINGLNKWHNNDNTTTMEPKSAAAMEQDLLGWDLALEGCISKNGVSNKPHIGKQLGHTNLAKDGQPNWLKSCSV